jgi:hypothetical protein
LPSSSFSPPPRLHGYQHKIFKKTKQNKTKQNKRNKRKEKKNKIKTNNGWKEERNSIVHHKGYGGQHSRAECVSHTLFLSLKMPTNIYSLM